MPTGLEARYWGSPLGPGIRTLELQWQPENGADGYSWQAVAQGDPWPVAWRDSADNGRSNWVRFATDLTAAVISYRVRTRMGSRSGTPTQRTVRFNQPARGFTAHSIGAIPDLTLTGGDRQFTARMTPAQGQVAYRIGWQVGTQAEVISPVYRQRTVTINTRLNGAAKVRLIAYSKNRVRTGTQQDVTLRALAPPGQPTVTLVATQAGCNATWPAVSGANNYQVRHRRQGQSWPSRLLSTTHTRFAITGYTAGQVVEVQVRAINADGAGDWSALRRATVLSTPMGPEPPTPSGRLRAPEITGTSATDTSITVTWGSLPGAQRWEVQWFRGGNPVGVSGFLAQSTQNYTIRNLTANVVYRVQIRGYSRPAGGTLTAGDWAVTTLATLSAGAIPPPSGFGGTITGNVASLYWDADPLADSWNILYRATNNAIDNGEFIRDGRAVAHDIDSLIWERRYQFRLRVNRRLDNGRTVRGEFTAPLYLTVGPRVLAAPRTPINVLAQAGDARITVSWTLDPNHVSDGVTYEIRWGPAPGAFNAEIITGITTARRSITGSGVTNGQQYQVEVRARNRTNGVSRWSTPVLVTPAAAPPRVTGFTLTATRNIIIGNWDAVTGAGGNVRYEVWLRRQADIDAGLTAYRELTTSQTTFAFTVGFSEQWHAQVRVKTDGGTAAWTGPISVTTGAVTPPPVGMLPAPVMNPAVVVGDTIIWDWELVDGALIYDFEWRRSLRDIWTSVPVNGTAYTMTGDWDTIYRGRVSARNETHTSEPSVVVAAHVGPDPRILGTLSTPEGLTATRATGIIQGVQTDDSFVRLEWQPVDNAYQYQVRGRVQGAMDWTVGAPVGAEYNWFVWDGDWDTNYEFSVRALGREGSGVADSPWLDPPVAYLTPPNLPVKPTAWTLTADFTTVTAAWQPVQAATSYRLRWRVKAADDATEENEWDNRETAMHAMSISDLVARTTYEFQLTGVNRSSAADNYVWSDIKEIETGVNPQQDVNAPNVPRNLTTMASGARIWAAWRVPLVDAAHDAPSSYDLEYYRVSSDREYRTGIAATIWGTDVGASGTWTMRVRARNEGGVSAWVDGAPVRVALPAPDAIPVVPEALILDVGDGRGAQNYWHRVLSISGRWGGTGKGYLDRAPSCQGQALIANDDGAIDIQGIRINTTIRFISAFDGVVRDVLSGYIRDVSEQHDDELGQRTITIAYSGLFDRLAQEDGEIGLFVAHDALTSDVVSGALQRSNIIGGAARISHSSTRIAPSQDMVLVSGGHNVMAVLRSMELAEGCIMHEGRGLEVVFPSRWERAMTDPLAVSGSHPEGEAVFARVDADDDTPRITVRNPEVEWFYEHLFTRIDLTGGQSSRTRRIKVAEYDGNADGNNPIEILNGSVYEPVINIYDSDRHGRNQWRVVDGIYEVSSWDPVQTDPAADTNSHVYFQDAAGTQITDALRLGNISVETLSQNSGNIRLRIGNNSGATIYVREITLFGFGIQRLANFQVTGANFTAERTYGIRKTLRLSRVAAGEGYNDSDNPVAELEAYKDFLLWRYSQPRYVARLSWRMQDRYPGEPAGGMAWAQKQAYSLQVGDQVEVEDVNAMDIGGLPPGHYYVEGGDFSINVGTGERQAAVWVSRRDVIAAYTHDADVAHTSSGTAWVQVGGAIANPLSVSPRRGTSGIAVIAIRAKRNAAADGTQTTAAARYIMEVRVGGATTKGFVDRDFDSEYQWMTATFVHTGAAVSVWVRQLAGGTSVSIAEIRAFEP